MTDLDEFYPLCDVCGDVISIRDGQELGVYAIQPGDTPEGFTLMEVRRGFAKSSLMGSTDTAESQVMAAIGERAEANWHADREECRPQNLFVDTDQEDD